MEKEITEMKVKKYVVDAMLAVGMLVLLASAFEITATAGSPGGGGCFSTCKENSDCTSPDCPNCASVGESFSGTCK